MSAGAEPNEPLHQIDEIDRIDIADKLRELGDQLQRAAELMHSEKLSAELRERAIAGADLDEYEELALKAKADAEFRRALTVLRDFRRDYGRWERLIAEYALQHMNYTQRDAAKHLGVGVSTINRWAQHPLVIDEDR